MIVTKTKLMCSTGNGALEQTGTAHVGMGGGAGKVRVKDLAVTKYVDKATPELFKACCNGKVFKEATLTVRKAGEKPLEYLKIKMSDVLISKMDTGSKMDLGGNGNDGPPHRGCVTELCQSGSGIYSAKTRWLR